MTPVDVGKVVPGVVICDTDVIFVVGAGIVDVVAFRVVKTVTLLCADEEVTPVDVGTVISVVVVIEVAGDTVIAVDVVSGAAPVDIMETVPEPSFVT